MRKVLTIAAVALFAGTIAYAAKENCPSGKCNVQIKNAAMQPACPSGVQWPTVVDPTSCVAVGGTIVLTWNGLNTDHCYINYTDPSAVNTNGIVTVVFPALNGMVNGRFEHVPPWTQPIAAPGLSYNISCRGLAQFNEQNSTVQKLTRVIIQ